MKHTIKWTGLVLFAAAIGLALAVLFVSGTQAQSPVAVVQRAVAQATPYPGPGSYGYGGGYSSGMMGQGWSGYGNGGWGMGPGHMGVPGGMMGGYGWGYSNAAPQGTPVPVDEEIQLSAAGFRFDPATVTVKTGETVRLTVANKDNVPHNLYGSNVAFAYTLLPAGVVQSVTFTAPTTPGTYLAVCTFHPGMSLEIVVK